MIYDKLVKFARKQANYFCLIDPDGMAPQKAANFAKICQDNGAD